MDNERREQILDNWFSETNDSSTQEWRQDLTPEELDFVAAEDEAYCLGVQSICTASLLRERIRQRFQPREIEELTTIYDHCRLRLRDGRLFYARLSSDGALLLDEVDAVC